ncbi:MAG: 2-succinyl-5-enolpyruvyl-6-hydroxy-3-cyclohexene-1-carboxylic-acid synthase, partial [Candidatus Hydrogenedentes bacterium]|nr:2-succinyl-5-enolpyruvyl-6-hydroxy-3-cyclohexene-1-carboxylic-acid synthase [Candidatus Hydrogenedentota bacterium]
MPSTDPIRHAPNLNHAWAALLAEELARLGIKDIFLSPGSRSTPLAIAVASHPALRVHVHFDERGTAFAALGCALGSESTTALICTSGSAAANYLPAVVEASQSHVPLLLLTADRPPELLDCGANQAIAQQGLFGAYTRWEAQVPCPDLSITPAHALTTLDQAVARTRTPIAGPVHLNCMFREPLAPVDCPWPATWLDPLCHWLESPHPFTRYALPSTTLPEAAEREMLGLVARGMSGLLVVGQLKWESERQAVAGLVRNAPWPVFADITSGLRTGIAAHENIAYYDQLLQEGSGEPYVPGFVLHLGGALVSKRLQHYLRTLAARGVPSVRVADHPLRHDPDHCVTHRFTCDLAPFCRWLAPILKPLPRTPGAEVVRAMESNAAATLAEALDQGEELNELTVPRLLTQQRPPHSIIFAGNSMPVRDLDKFADPRGAEGPVHANRGASGIDGNLATVAGLSLGSERPVTAIVGDLTALHDLNSLALLQSCNRSVAIVIVNNNGGGIFSFLPVADATPHFERLFGAPHGLGFENAARLFNLAYAAPASRADFVDAYTRAMDHPGATIIEVRTDRTANVNAHRDLQILICTALEY